MPTTGGLVDAFKSELDPRISRVSPLSRRLLQISSATARTTPPDNTTMAASTIMAPLSSRHHTRPNLPSNSRHNDRRGSSHAKLRKSRNSSKHRRQPRPSTKRRSNRSFRRNARQSPRCRRTRVWRTTNCLRRWESASSAPLDVFASKR